MWGNNNVCFFWQSIIKGINNDEKKRQRSQFWNYKNWRSLSKTLSVILLIYFLTFVSAFFSKKVTCRYYDCNRDEVPYSSFDTVVVPMTVITCPRRYGAEFVSVTFDENETPHEPIPLTFRIYDGKIRIYVLGFSIFYYFLKVYNWKSKFYRGKEWSNFEYKVWTVFYELLEQIEKKLMNISEVSETLYNFKLFIILFFSTKSSAKKF